MNNFLSRFMGWLKLTDNLPDEIQRAKQFISAIDAGGIPLYPARIIKHSVLNNAA